MLNLGLIHYSLLFDDFCWNFSCHEGDENKFSTNWSAITLTACLYSRFCSRGGGLATNFVSVVLCPWSEFGVPTLVVEASLAVGESSTSDIDLSAFRASASRFIGVLTIINLGGWGLGVESGRCQLSQRRWLDQLGLWEKFVLCVKLRGCLWLRGDSINLCVFIRAKGFKKGFKIYFLFFSILKTFHLFHINTSMYSYLHYLKN